LHSVEQALRWAGTMTWRTIHPLIREVTTTYERGVRLTKAAFRQRRDNDLPLSGPVG
jgi:hypothetical protein